MVKYVNSLGYQKISHLGRKPNHDFENWLRKTSKIYPVFPIQIVLADEEMFLFIQVSAHRWRKIGMIDYLHFVTPNN